ncbi:MAG: transcriptional regulator [Anaerolineales bacterium]|nr:transcriptional regulator [Anaerolineales bacterium]
MNPPEIASIELNLEEIDRLIHEPARLLVMALLYVVDSADFIFLRNQTNLTWGNLSAHVSKLEEAGYIEVEKFFKGKRPNTELRLTAAGRQAFQAHRARLQRLLDGLPE